MKTFCPACHRECVTDLVTSQSICCNQPAFIGCSTCGKRLIQLGMVVHIDQNPKPIYCYACHKKALNPNKKPGAPEWLSQALNEGNGTYKP
jgi:hypothetical protein